jgi:hypothetical protein
MINRKIQIEAPPVSDPVLNEWLSRMIIMINAALDQAHILPPVGKLPDKMQEGMIVNFSQAILPDITSPGPWIVIGGTWIQMA